jgi:nitroimidazol reductase NimA-like FMN-containing flavoprotein (pyridoxamine 5'-phosphate oxidase superfamily)
MGGRVADVNAAPVLEELTRDQCLALLRTREIGRLAVSWPTGPLVVPVNFVVDDDAIVFRSGPGTKLRALASRPVSFQVDAVDPVHRTGWSVLARGRAREVPRREIDHLELEAWVPDDKDHWVRLHIVSVSGVRISVAELWPLDLRGYR